ncbi:hypothetical protein M431DRAFT_471281 [Trichoderma harzianum CBS 226.95]|uniref:Uncharacterized protein n=1 Tax=Trichoderma harzianum CBS 226.95 TaxID=983964 RepID=A0A2T4A6U7_TRIHA|nr:hypothetical protein M431DRAFT_471281 [Trichoderma harzianum CBS 226.95]PTB52756.1 hypothetical protein M431DRAFT_471281 [Trichoderma harzianum CBS 226.95]
MMLPCVFISCYLPLWKKAWSWRNRHNDCKSASFSRCCRSVCGMFKEACARVFDPEHTTRTESQQPGSQLPPVRFLKAALISAAEAKGNRLREGKEEEKMTKNAAKTAAHQVENGTSTYTLCKPLLLAGARGIFPAEEAPSSG